MNAKGTTPWACARCMCGHPDRHVFRISRGINVGYSRERGPLHTSAKIAGRVRSPFNVLASQARLSA